MFKAWGDCAQQKDTTGKVISEVATLSCIPAIFSNVLTALLMFVGTFALFLFIFAGFRYMNTGGDPKKLEGAKNTLVYGTVGLLIVLFSFFIIQLISLVTGAPCITKFGFACPSPTPIP